MAIIAAELMAVPDGSRTASAARWASKAFPAVSSRKASFPSRGFSKKRPVEVRGCDEVMGFKETKMGFHWRFLADGMGIHGIHV